MRPLGWVCLLSWGTGCVDAQAGPEPGPCASHGDCAADEVCVAGSCTDAWDDLEYRLDGVSVSNCEGEYMMIASFDGEALASATTWQECPASWSPNPELSTFVPTSARERFVIAFSRRYQPSPAATLDWEGVPREVLHYGQWEGDADGHRVGVWLSLSD